MADEQEFWFGASSGYQDQLFSSFCLDKLILVPNISQPSVFYSIRFQSYHKSLIKSFLLISVSIVFRKNIMFSYKNDFIA